MHGRGNERCAGRSWQQPEASRRLCACSIRDQTGLSWDTELDRIVAEQVLSQLPEHHRTVLALRYMDDCSVPECAELIGRTVHATEALLVRARRAFRAQYPTLEGGMP